jgi:hypothetical protein
MNLDDLQKKCEAAASHGDPLVSLEDYLDADDEFRKALTPSIALKLLKIARAAKEMAERADARFLSPSKGAVSYTPSGVDFRDLLLALAALSDGG